MFNLFSELNTQINTSLREAKVEKPDAVDLINFVHIYNLSDTKDSVNI